MTLPLLTFEKTWCISADLLPNMLSAFARAAPGSAPSPRANLSPGAVGRTQIIEIVGPLSKYPDMFQFFFGGTAMVDVATRIALAADNPAVDSILLYVDSPGGTASGTDELAAAIFAARQVKPVVAYVSDRAASGAYWVASQATKIYANALAFVGSIGVYMVVEDWSQAYSDAGVKVDVIKAGDFKGIGEPGSEFTPAQCAEIQKLVNAMHSQFIQAVARGRRLPADQVRGLADGRVFGAAEAKNLGLIDGIVTGFEDLLNLPRQAEQERLQAEQAQEARLEAEDNSRWAQLKEKKEAEEKAEEARRRKDRILNSETAWH